MINLLKTLWLSYKYGMKAHEFCNKNCKQGRECTCKKVPVSQQADKVST